jgi:serine/threonine protein phosphatase PrpC
MSRLLEVVAAELPGNGTTSEDRVRVGTNAVVVLDGASGSDTRVSVADYVDHLSSALVEVLDDEPDMPLPHALADAIRSTVGALRVMPGESPSSTVSIARRRGEGVDLLVLGDSPIYIGPDSQLLTDDRLAQLDLPSRTKANQRLREGAGYDDVHRDLVRAVRAEQLPWLNEPGGYWIAEARPEAAYHAVTRTVSAELPWLVMLTDGVDKPLRHLDISPAVGLNCTTVGLTDFLEQLHGWEIERDPDAHLLPRFKRHDDKTVAVVTFQ